MIEIITEAIVLTKEVLGEYDSLVFLYTKESGKVAAKATSARKITSKLAPHLEPLSHIASRLVSRRDFDGRGFQLADALLIAKARHCEGNAEKLKGALQVFDFINRAIPEGAPDLELWDFLYDIIIRDSACRIEDALKFLGFGQPFARCELCGKTQPEYFYLRNNSFICRHCVFVSQASEREYIKLC